MEILDDTGFPIMFLDDEWVYEGLVEKYGEEKAPQMFKETIEKAKKQNEEVLKKLKQNNSETNNVEPKPGTHNDSDRQATK